MTRALVVIDGEHYAPVVRDAIAGLPYAVLGAWRAGGTEKLRGGEDYGVPLVDSFDVALADVDVVVDLSDEPVLGPRERFLLASRTLAAGVRYEGADFRFEPPHYAPFPLPSLAVIGTGKRVGKTAVTGHVARLLARDRDVVVVSMGRGGPAEPEVAAIQPTLASLLDMSRAGHHAASDYLETAALTGVVTIGCRRAGGGLAGGVVTSNVEEGAALAAERDPDVVVFDASGAAIPPVETDARILVSGRGHDPLAYLNPYRVLVSDLVVLVGGGDAGAIRELKDVRVLPAELRLRAVAPLRGRRVAVFTTGPAAKPPLPLRCTSAAPKRVCTRSTATPSARKSASPTRMTELSWALCFSESSAFFSAGFSSGFLSPSFFSSSFFSSSFLSSGLPLGNAVLNFPVRRTASA